MVNRMAADVGKRDMMSSSWKRERNQRCLERRSS